jgi:predicted ATPase
MAVWFIALEASTGSDRAMRTIMEAVGARVEGGSTALDAVVSSLEGAPALLCLDNLEQIPDAATLVLDLLQRLPALTVLATSRRALRLQSEHEIRLDPLTVPGSTDPPSMVGEVPAVQLFVSRAGNVQRSFELTEHNAAIVAEITRRLDGVPLAIELAAARCRLLAPEQILDRLGDRMDVVSGGGPDLPERQRALRTTLEWSHDLLDPEARAVFARLGVFADGWTLDSAQAVVGDLDALEALAGLLDNSLIGGKDGSTPGVDPRFGMLAIVRGYALERLEERGEVESARTRHLDYFRTLGERAQPSLCGPGQREWLARLDPERANLREAVSWALDTERFADVVELTWDVIVHYFVRDAVEEPDSWLGRVMHHEPALDRITTAKLESIHALTRIHHGDYTDVHRRLEGPLEVFREHDMAFEAAVTLHQLGFVRFALDHDATGALAALAESAQLFDRLGHEWGVSLVEAMRGSLHAATGEFDTAREHLAVALDRARAIECEPQQVQALVQLALVEVAAGRADRALPCLQQSAGMLRSGRYLNDGATCLVAAAALAQGNGHLDLARRAVTVASDVRRRLGVTPWPTLARFISDVEGRVGVEPAAADDAGPDPFDVLDSLIDAVRTGRQATS